jgi:hypothetical protein
MVSQLLLCALLGSEPSAAESPGNTGPLREKEDPPAFERTLDLELRGGLVSGGGIDLVDPVQGGMVQLAVGVRLTPYFGLTGTTTVGWLGRPAIPRINFVGNPIAFKAFDLAARLVVPDLGRFEPWLSLGTGVVNTTGKIVNFNVSAFQEENTSVVLAPAGVVLQLRAGFRVAVTERLHLGLTGELRTCDWFVLWDLPESDCSTDLAITAGPNWRF